MKIRLYSLCALILFGSAFSHALPEAPVDLLPKIPKHVVFRPTFLTRDFSFTAGTGFLLEGRSMDSSFLVTVHHLFGPAGGLEKQIAGDKIPLVFPRAVGFSFDPDPILLTTDEGYPVADARKGDDKGCEKDIALYRVRGWSANKSLELSKQPPLVGEKVWLVLRNIAKDDLLFAECVVAWRSATEVRYLLNNPDLLYSGASGAPVVDAYGNVVAMHVGTFTAQSGRKFGFGCPAAAIYAALPNE
jgi:hypothetical protein